MNSKHQLVDVEVQRVDRRHRPLLVAMLALVAWTTWVYRDSTPIVNVIPPSQTSSVVASAEGKFDWSKLLPSETLDWVPCYEVPFQCMRLEVPLDYAKPHGQKAAIALMKYPSKYPLGHELYRGPILYNPGGPGGSGVEQIYGYGRNFSALIGDDFDHISFDPRGIGRTTPTLRTFATDAERTTWDLVQPPSANSTPDALARLAGYARILGGLVEERQRHTARHMSTAIVARDMLAITRAHGREKVLYWGFSYGSVLGITFAAMFPDNIERLIVDGVVDTENYYAAAWDNNLLDTDKGLRLTLAECAASSLCPLHEPTGALVSARLAGIIAQLETAPLSVRNGTTYGLVDATFARTMLFHNLYNPVRGFAPLFAALAAVERGDGWPLYELGGSRASSWRCDCAGDGGGQPIASVPGEATYAVACSDGDVVSGETIEETRARYARMGATSAFADLWTIHSACTGWKVRAVERFNGLFKGNTSHPILLIGNVADPVTPLWAAKKMSKGFKDAVVLTQNSAGHCSLAAPSLCTAKHIRAYFRNGTLPAPGTLCEVDAQAFPPDEEVHAFPSDKKEDVQVLGQEDRELLEVARALSSRFEVPRLGLV